MGNLIILFEETFLINSMNKIQHVRFVIIVSTVEKIVEKIFLWELSFADIAEKTAKITRIRIKVARYSFTIAHIHSSSNVRMLKGKHTCFSIFMTSTSAQKAKLTVNFLVFP